MALSPNIQLEAAFVTPEGQNVIELWEFYERRIGVEREDDSHAWGVAYRLWAKHFEHIASSQTAYYYWLDNHGPMGYSRVCLE